MMRLYELLNNFLQWFVSISPSKMIFFWMMLVFAEYFINKIFGVKSKKARFILFNIWEFFGLFVPVFWILRLDQAGKVSAVAVIVVAGMGMYYGLYKPLSSRKQKKKRENILL